MTVGIQMGNMEVESFSSPVTQIKEKWVGTEIGLVAQTLVRLLVLSREPWHGLSWQVKGIVKFVLLFNRIPVLTHKYPLENLISVR